MTNFFTRKLSLATIALTLLVNLPILGSIDDDLFDQVSDEELLLVQADMQTKTISPAAGATILSTLKAHKLFSKNMYKRSNPLDQRLPHDQPIVRFASSFDDDKVNFAVDAFFSATDKVFYTYNDRTADAYINLTGDNILGFIGNLADAPTITSDDIIETLPFFERMFHNERSFGFLGQLNAPIKNWSLHLSTPLYYIERNANMTLADQEALSETNLIKALPEAPPEAVIEYIKAHLSTDRFGLGDTNLIALYNVKSNDLVKVFAGASLVIPTAVSFEDGVFLGNLRKNTDTSIYQLCDILDLFRQGQNLVGGGASQADILEMAKKIFYASSEMATDVLEKLSSNIAYPSLGNNGHIEFGPHIEFTAKVTDELTWKLRGEVRHSFGAKEKRFFITKRDASDFVDPFTTSQVPDFVNQTSNEWFFPFMYETWVTPGLTAHMVTELNFERKKWLLNLGYDFWSRGQESLDVKGSPSDIDIRLDKAIAVAPQAQEHTMFTRLGYNYQGRSKIWNISAFASNSFIHRGIDSGYRFALAVETSF